MKSKDNCREHLADSLLHRDSPPFPETLLSTYFHAKELKKQKNPHAHTSPAAVWTSLQATDHTLHRLCVKDMHNTTCNCYRTALILVLLDRRHEQHSSITVIMVVCVPL